MCNHTKDIPGGTWIDRKAGNRTAVVCSVCGRFYGYRRANEAKEQRIRKADRK